jgi:hypothetical protein
MLLRWHAQATTPWATGGLTEAMPSALLPPARRAAPAAKMSAAEERSLRNALSFAGRLQHPGLLAVKGQWEDDRTLAIVEELACTDLLADSMHHPSK